MDNAKEKRAVTFQESYRSTAVVHTYLAWQDEPGSPLGQFITKQAPQPNKEIAVSFGLFWADKLSADSAKKWTTWQFNPNSQS